MADKFKDEKHRAKILDRIKKLLAVANGTNYEAEAATALRMAQSYMSSYGLDMTDVELQDDLAGEIVELVLDEHNNRLNPEHWEQVLCLAVGTVFDCKPVRFHYDRTRSKMAFVGFKKDVGMAKIVFSSLYVSCRAAACRALPTGNGRPRLSFMYGVAERLYERAAAEKEKAKEEPTGRFALIVVEKAKQVENWTEDNMNLRTQKLRERKLDADAYRKGREHANSMDLMNREKVNKEEPLRIC